MADKFETFRSGLESPAYGASAVTASNDTDLPTVSRSLFIGGSGNLVVDMAAGGTVTFTNVQVGILPVRVKRVRATGTTATNIVALW